MFHKFNTMPSFKKQPTRAEKIRQMRQIQALRIDHHRERKDLVADPYNILKLLNHVFVDAKLNHNIDQRQMLFLFFIFDLELFSVEWAIRAFGYTGRQDNFMDMTLQPMVEGGHVVKYCPAQDKDLIVIMERNNKQTARYKISGAGRKVVKKYLDKLHGRKPILVDEKTHFRMFLEE